MTASASDVADWMKEVITNEGYLYQDVAASEIASRFGAEFSYINSSGNLAIREDVLKLFRKMTADSVIWERGQRIWRRRESYDLPGRQQP